jgi:hypothetical protein
VGGIYLDVIGQFHQFIVEAVVKLARQFLGHVGEKVRPAYVSNEKGVPHEHARRTI